MGKIKAIVKRPDEAVGHVTWISNRLEAMQATVGGHIETAELLPGVVMICNEEGKLLGLPKNFQMRGDVIVGTVIICGVDGEEFGDIPIPLDQWRRRLMVWGNKIGDEKGEELEDGEKD